MTKSTFSSQPQYTTFSLLLLIFTVVTLLPHYEEIATPDNDVRTNLIVHGALFLGWYLLVYVQSLLIVQGKVAAHRWTGLLGTLLGFALLASGIDMLYGVMKSGDASRASFVWGILHTTLFFFSFFTLAILNRGNQAAHKRLIILASLSMISASVTRIAYLPFIPIDGTAFTLLSTYVFLAIPILIDKIRFGVVHPVLKWGVPLYLVTQIICVGILPGTELGRRIAFPF